MNSVIDLDWNGPPTQLEIAWVGSQDSSTPVMVFLHEGLGSVSLWRDYPDQLCKQLNMRGLLYSRPGYGKSTVRKPHEKWGVDFMHQQALEVLPALLKQLHIHQPWLFGHSDGGSIALLYAAHFPNQLDNQSKDKSSCQPIQFDDSGPLDQTNIDNPLNFHKFRLAEANP